MLQEASGWLSTGSPVLVGVFKRILLAVWGTEAGAGRGGTWGFHTVRVGAEGGGKSLDS